MSSTHNSPGYLVQLAAIVSSFKISYRKFLGMFLCRLHSPRCVGVPMNALPSSSAAAHRRPFNHEYNALFVVRAAVATAATYPRHYHWPSSAHCSAVRPHTQHTHTHTDSLTDTAVTPCVRPVDRISSVISTRASTPFSLPSLTLLSSSSHMLLLLLLLFCTIFGQFVLRHAKALKRARNWNKNTQIIAEHNPNPMNVIYTRCDVGLLCSDDIFIDIHRVYVCLCLWPGR